MRPATLALTQENPPVNKTLALTAIFLTTFVHTVHAAPAGFQGVDASGRPCALELADDHTITLRTGSGYVFAGIPFTPGQHALSFDALTIQRGEKFYSPPIGAPITFGNVGLLQVTGEVRMDLTGVNPSHVSFRAVGGIANWWRATFRCSRVDS